MHVLYHYEHVLLVLSQQIILFCYIQDFQCFSAQKVPICVRIWVVRVASDTWGLVLRTQAVVHGAVGDPEEGEGRGQAAVPATLLHPDHMAGEPPPVCVQDPLPGRVVWVYQG